MHSLLLNNTKILPYNINNDTLRFIVKLMTSTNMSYKPDVSVSLYAKYDGITTTLVTTATTNDYGASTILYATNNILDKTLRSCIFWTECVIDTVLYKSNAIRVNFLDIPIPESLIIDANLTVGLTNRNTYVRYDANTNRSNAIIIGRP